MTSQVIDKEMINNPRHWRLLLRVSDDSLDVVIYDAAQDNSLICRHIPLTADSDGDTMRSLEEAVYDNQALLLDYGRTDVVVETQRFIIIPDGISSREMADAAFAETFPLTEGELISSSLHGLGATIWMNVDMGLAGFLRRTFNNPRIHHHLAPLCRYFSSKSKLGNTGKMYANFHGDRVDIMIFGQDGLLVANTFKYREPVDALYYIFACRSQYGTGSGDDELFLAGDNGIRETLTPMLREYVAYVMPVIFPSVMFKAGREAMDAPFDLITLPLCE
ncbi:MAG: DUF3822 family protein [Pseudoflavonifractor sp.]|nr:DUF3822 family protein [Pseudoflavonifractor sp.]